jgi:hypothetical protein
LLLADVTTRERSEKQTDLQLILENRASSHPGLPDGSFSNQKSQFGYILEGLGNEKVGIFFGYFENITAIYSVHFLVIW